MDKTKNSSTESVRLLIWDLDDTFWRGTLTEGGATLIERNIGIVKTLAERGIMNSICSKNDLNKVREVLDHAGVWEYFIFPRIAWQPKGAMVKEIVEISSLRPETVMFIDDNTINLNEVAFYNPEVQIEEPKFLEDILDDRRFKGKDDHDLTRLRQYKILEQKEYEKKAFHNNGRDFLRQSDVRISFHHDIVENFDRIYELINRTNQLNFTKKRLSEHREEAYSEIVSDLKIPSTRAAYIKASDKYGSYGIIGFYMMKKNGRRGRWLEHFTFSCRTMNMGIEQFVFRKIGIVALDIVGEVVSDIRTTENLDWITVVDDAEHRTSLRPVETKKVCFRGACELDQAIHYMGHRFPILKEFPFPNRGWAVHMPAVHFASILNDLRSPENYTLLDKLPSLHSNIINSVALNNTADIYILSFSMEYRFSYYKYRKTGIVLPLNLSDGVNVGEEDITKLSYEDIRGISKIEFSKQEWTWFQQNFEYIGEFNEGRFRKNIHDLMEIIKDKEIIIILLNTRHGKMCKLTKFNMLVNRIVTEEAEPYHSRFISIDDLIQDDDEVVDAHHFHREVYRRLASEINVIIDRSVIST